MTNIELFTCANGETRCWSSYSIITNELIRGCSSTNLTETGCVTDNQNGMICRKSKIRDLNVGLEHGPGPLAIGPSTFLGDTSVLTDFIQKKIWLWYRWMQYSSTRRTKNHHRCKWFEFKFNRKGLFWSLYLWSNHQGPPKDPRIARSRDRLVRIGPRFSKF